VAKEPTRPAGRGSDQFVIRFPEGMRDRIAKLAAANGRSMNAELIDRLEKSLVDSDDIKDLENTVAQLWEKIDLIKEILEMHDHDLGRTAQKSGLFAQFNRE
jgi:plasmid stability protein